MTHHIMVSTIGSKGPRIAHTVHECHAGAVKGKAHAVRAIAIAHCKNPHDTKLTCHCLCALISAILTIVLLGAFGDVGAAFGPMIGGWAQEVIDFSQKF